MSSRTLTILSAACLIACASVADAQSKTERSFTAVSDNCDSVQWSEQTLASYPKIGAACQGVQERNGKRYVKFEGTVKRVLNHGQQLVMNFEDAGDITLTPPPDLTLSVNGKKTPISQLERGAELKFYVAEDRLAAQFPEEPEVEIQSVRFVVVPIHLHEPTEQLASLPHTAGPLPWLALAGTFSLGLGGLLSLYRRRRQ
jgi:LPXTG-motif cell wall-anchored protein